MNLKLVRQIFTDKSTIGELYIDGAQEAWTLELPNKDGLHGSCISAGTYKMACLYSFDFGRNMPHLVDVPERSHIMLHWGNTPSDTKGCILLGHSHADNWVGSSRAAFDALWPKFMDGLKAGDVTIEVVGGFEIPNPQVATLDAQDL